MTHGGRYSAGVGGLEHGERSTAGFVAGQLRFAIDVTDQIGDAVRRAFSALPTIPGSEAECRFCITRMAESGAPMWVLSGPNVPGYVFSDAARLIDALVTAVNLTALDCDPTALHLHASAAGRHGSAVLVIGESGSGKTTLVANLAASGWDYVTDEMIRLTPGSGAVSGFAKPLSIRSSSRGLVTDASGEPVGTGEEGGTVHISPADLGFRIVGEAIPRLLLFSQRVSATRGQPPTASPLAPVDAVVRMMSQTMDAERFGDRTFELLARLAASARSYELEVGEPSLMISMVDRLLADAQDDDPLEVCLARGSHRVAPEVLTVFVGEGAAIRHDTAGTVLALDKPGCLIWRELLGVGDPGLVDLDGPVESQFVSQLRSLQLLVESQVASKE